MLLSALPDNAGDLEGGSTDFSIVQSLSDTPPPWQDQPTRSCAGARNRRGREQQNGLKFSFRTERAAHRGRTSVCALPAKRDARATNRSAANPSGQAAMPSTRLRFRRLAWTANSDPAPRARRAETIALGFRDISLCPGLRRRALGYRRG